MWAQARLYRAGGTPASTGALDERQQLNLEIGSHCVEDVGLGSGVEGEVGKRGRHLERPRRTNLKGSAKCGAYELAHKLLHAAVVRQLQVEV